jgi:hypothetical protein
MNNHSVSKTAIIKLLSLCILLLPAISYASICYGVGADFSQGIYEINFQSGTVDLLFATPGLGWRGATDGDGDHPNTIYATPYEDDALYRVDVVNKTYTKIGSYGTRVTGLAYDEKNDVLYGTDYINLFSIDITDGSPTEGQATVIGPLGAFGSAWAIDYDSSIDQLVAMSRLSTSTILYHVDRTTGHATYMGTTSDKRITDVWYDDESEKLFAISNDPYYTEIGKLFEVDPMTGDTTYISDTTENIIGLGAPIPEPVTMSLLALGSVVLIRKRKK